MSVLDRFNLTGKRLFITGGSRGLGREMALAIADAGADVILVGRDPASLETTAGDIRALGRQSWTLVADVGKPAECEQACQSALQRHGPIDILINNVGGRRENIPTESMTLDKWRELIDLNLTSCMPLHAMARGGDDRARPGRAHHQHRVDQRPRRRPRHRRPALRNGEGGDAPVHPRDRRRLGGAQDHGERHPAGRLPDGAEPALVETSSGGDRAFPREHPARRFGQPEDLGRLRCTSPATPHVT